jgi:hypothetical protein
MARKASSNPPFNDSDTALRGSAFLQSEASPQVVSAAKDNMPGVDFVCLRCAPAVLANGPAPEGSSNQSGDCPARSASIKTKAKPQSLPRQRDIRRALIEADLGDTAMRDSAILQREASLQVLSAAKNNMVALPGQLFYSTPIPVCLWFLAKNKAADAERGFRDRRKQTLFIDARKLDTVARKKRPRRRTTRIAGAFRVQKNSISEQTKGFSRLRPSETAWIPKFA